MTPIQEKIVVLKEISMRIPYVMEQFVEEIKKIPEFLCSSKKELQSLIQEPQEKRYLYLTLTKKDPHKMMSLVLNKGSTFP